MKKKITCLLLALLCVFTFAVSVFAAESEPQLYHVTDTALILSDEEDYRLEEMAQTVSAKYGVGVYIVTVNGYREVDPTGVFETTYGIYHEYTMGAGDGRDGIMLLLSMAERDYALFCYGEDTAYAFSEYGQEQLEKVFLDNFEDNDWYGGFEDYIRECAVYLQKAADGSPVRKRPVKLILLLDFLALIIAGIVCGAAYAKMKSVHKKRRRMLTRLADCI